MIGDLLFGRYFLLHIGKIKIDALDIDFEITKTRKKEPNTLDLTIYNLNPTHRGQLQAKKDIVVQLDAGYAEKHGVIFLGDVLSIRTEYDGVDWKTVVSAGDGQKATQFDRINKSFTKGTGLYPAVKEIAKAMPKINIGNIDEILSKPKYSKKQFANGITLSGSAARQMQTLIRSAGLQWSIQDQQFQILEAGKSLPFTSVILNEDTGLIGSPTVGNDGVIEFRSLLNSDIMPGRQLHIQSKLTDSHYRVERCTYDGSTASNSWYVSGEAREIKTL